jgi:hypothetical protein
LPTFFAGSSFVSGLPPNKRFNQPKKPPLLSVFVSTGAGLATLAVSGLGISRMGIPFLAVNWIGFSFFYCF